MSPGRVFLERIEQQRALCHELYAVTREQLASLDSADYERLQILLDKRQALLERLTPLDPDLPGDWESYSAVERDSISQARQEVAQLLRDILAMDQSARGRMESHRAELQLAIREVRQGRQGLAGYRQTLEISPRLFDQSH